MADSIFLDSHLVNVQYHSEMEIKNSARYILTALFYSYKCIAYLSRHLLEINNESGCLVTIFGKNICAESKNKKKIKKKWKRKKRNNKN